MQVLDQLPQVKGIVCYGIDKIPEKYAKDTRIFLWKDFLKFGSEVPDQNLETLIQK
jgi:hypothetical protein